jgi:hypothetical protein
MSLELEQRLNMLIQAAADSLAELRKTDVMRVIESAEGSGLLEEMKTKIETERPDLKEEVAECIEEL